MVTKSFCVFIIDFGLSCCVEDAAHIDHSCGTPAYCSPEVYSGEISSYPRDVWALGVILFELVTGSSPFYDGNTKNKKDIFTNIIKKLILPDSITLECQDLLKHMLFQDPDKRITSKNILQHDWFKDVASAETLSGVQEFHVNSDTCDIVGRHYDMLSADIEACLSEDARNACTTYYHLLFKKHQNPLDQF